MQVKIIIPARWESSRFPGKPMANINGCPMIIHVCRRVAMAIKKADIRVATDDMRIHNIVKKNGYKAMLTGDCSTGTDRVFQAARKIKADIYINVQGDEPLVNPEDIQAVIAMKIKFPDYVIGSMALLKENECQNLNRVKVLVDNNMNMLKMTRQAIDTLWRQCGLYAFTLKELKQFVVLEHKEVEKIELTRITKVKMVAIKGSPAVDMPDDIKIIEGIINDEKEIKKTNPKDKISCNGL